MIQRPITVQEIVYAINHLLLPMLIEKALILSQQAGAVVIDQPAQVS